jgi:hypothetical protein
MVFGDRAPKPLQWWAPWVYVVFFGAVAAFLTYGASIDQLPPGKGGVSQGVFVTGLFWLATFATLVLAIVRTIRRRKY